MGQAVYTAFNAAAAAAAAAACCLAFKERDLHARPHLIHRNIMLLAAEKKLKLVMHPPAPMSFLRRVEVIDLRKCGGFRAVMLGVYGWNATGLGLSC